MTPQGYTHLHVHSEMSYMDGHAKIPRLVQKAAENQQTALALTDHGTLAGAWKFAAECHRQGIKPILGMETYLAIGPATQQNSLQTPGDDGTLKEKRYYHLTLLAQNHDGWVNLIKIHDLGHDHYWYKPRVDYEILQQYSEGIICLTGCLAGPVAGPLSQAVNQTPQQAELLQTAICHAYEAENDSWETLETEANTWLTAMKKPSIGHPTDHEIEAVLHQALTAWAASSTNPDPTALKNTWDLNQQHLQAIHRLEARTQHSLYQQAETALNQLKQIYGSDRVFVEIMEHGIPAEQNMLPHLASLARKHGLKCVATNDPHYCTETDAPSHDAWIALTTAKTGQAALDTPGRFRFNGEGYWLKTETEMRSLHAQDWWQQACSNTMLVADMIGDNVLGETKMHLPVFPTKPGETPDQLLARLIKQGCETKYGTTPDTETKQRLNREYNVIRRLGLSSYFLIVQDFIRWARSDYTPQDWISLQNGGVPGETRQRKTPIMIGPGRGSAGGSAVAYVLDITRLDPIRHHLLFERFLDPTRIGMPDIDVDVEKNRLPEAHQYMRLRWGEKRVARIGSFQTMGPRACIKDAARLLGVPEKTANALTKTIPLVDGKWPKLAELAETSGTAGADFRRQLAKLPQNQAARLVGLAASFDGLTRGEGIHASGLLISDIDIDQVVPTRMDRDNPGAPRITVWDGKDVDAAGMLKLDLLGLRNLDVITSTLAYIRQATGETIVFPDPDEDTPETRKTWGMLKKGQTTGVFQLESSLAAEITMSLGPECWDDLTAINALNRPGPLSAGIDRKYADRRNGREPVDYTYLTSIPAETQAISSVLDKTLGLIPYQETAMIVGREIAGFGAKNVNRLRKAISKKNKAEFPILKSLFIEGATRDVSDDGVGKLAFTEQTARRLWEQIEGSASYSFNASHSAAYGLLSFYTAFLKGNWPVQYAAALLAATDSVDKRRPLIQELATQGIVISQPDINQSGVDTAPVEDRVLLGLSEIKGVGVDVARAIVDARRRLGGCFSDLKSLAGVPGVTATQIVALAEAGALDGYGPRRGVCIVARLLGRGQEVCVPDTEWAYSERYRRVVARVGIPLGESPLRKLGGDFLSWSRALGVGVPLRSLSDVVVASAGARLDVPAVVTRWQPIAKSYGTICAVTLANNTVSVDGWVWNRDYSVVAETGVGVGSVVRARVEPRVREFEVDALDGGVTVQARVECSVRRLWVMPVEAVESPLPPAPVGFLGLTAGGGGCPKGEAEGGVVAGVLPFEATLGGSRETGDSDPWETTIADSSGSRETGDSDPWETTIADSSGSRETGDSDPRETTIADSSGSRETGDSDYDPAMFTPWRQTYTISTHPTQ